MFVFLSFGFATAPLAARAAHALAWKPDQHVRAERAAELIAFEIKIVRRMDAVVVLIALFIATWDEAHFVGD